MTLAFVSFRGPTYQNIVLNSSRTNIDCDRDLGHGAPYVLYGDLFFPHTKSQSVWVTPVEETHFKRLVKFSNEYLTVFLN